jgi:hypothetical protein
MKTSELIDGPLDWAVAKCLGYAFSKASFAEHGPYAPSTNWEQGGPIVEREKMQIYASASQWTASDFFGKTQTFGPTPLIAAMRCLVASKLGDEIEIPEELTT